MSPWEKVLERPPLGGHFVQLYEADQTALANNVGLYVWEGLRRGEGALLIATPEHSHLFSERLKQLGADLPQLLASQQLVLWDAAQTLAQFMIHGQPDWERFEKVIRDAMHSVAPSACTAGLRAYGEMVGILWNTRHFAAAVRVEQLWNRLLGQSGFSLYCAYAVDVFGKEFELSNLEAVLCTHTHLVPAQTDGSLEKALNQSIDEILGVNGDKLRMRIKASSHPSWAVMPNPENTLLWLRRNLPIQADQIIERARHHYLALETQAPMAG